MVPSMTIMHSDTPPLVVLAGGFGTRLRSVVSDVPKTIAPIGKTPFLHCLMDSWIRQGVRSFIFLLYHEAEKIVAALDGYLNTVATSIKTDWIVEPEPLGTGGSIANAVRQRQMEGDFLVANSDTWLSGGIAEIKVWPSPTLTVVEVENSHRYGQVKISGDTVAEFVEKKNSLGKSWINAGLYRLNAGIFADWDGKAFSLETNLFPKLVAEKKLKACPIRADFTDIGVPEDYEKFIRYARENILIKL